MNRTLFIAVAATAIVTPALAQAQTRAAMQSDISALRADLAAARGQLAKQEARLQALEARLTEQGQAIASLPAGPASGQSASPLRNAENGIERVGTSPVDADRPPEVAVLGMEGSVVTRRGQLTAEAQLDYTRADRNRAVFRGIELVESVLVGVFDVNESRQDVLTGAAALRYGVTDKFEVGARVPYVYRSDASILAPIAGSTNNDGAATIDNSAKGNGLGDIELSARYQLASAKRGWPFLIANLQAVFPTGTSPFSVPRDTSGRALKAATGAGFYGVSPSLTMILPSDPAVLFGTIGYTWNAPRNVNTRIPPVQIDRVDPGDAISASLGLGISLNQRLSFNLGYAHSWAFGTKTQMRTVDNAGVVGPETISRSRDLQIGRLLFGVTYRASDRASINWSVEVGATNDAPNVRTVLRIPIVLLTGG